MSEEKKEIVIANTNLEPVDNVVQQFKMVHELYEKIMIKDEHYGMIPGTKKDTLYKAGAEKLCLLFKLVPKIESKYEKDLGNNHKEIEITIGLYHKETGLLWGQGIGSCSTMESKYRYRNSADFEVTDLPIPKDAKDNKAKYRKEGFGMQKVDGVWMWVHYTGEGKTENPDIADQYNTILKMAYKRALVSATITATGVSDIFTQDVEDFVRDKYTEATDEKVKREFQGEEVNQSLEERYNALPDKIKQGFKLTGWTLKQIKDKCVMYDFNEEKIEADIKSILDK